MPIEPLAVAARIKQARLEANLTQEEMADLLHVRQRTYQNYESQSRRLVRVPFRLLDQIAEATDKTAEWLLHGTAAPADPDQMERTLEMLESIDERLRTLERMLSQLDEGAPPQTLRKRRLPPRSKSTTQTQATKAQGR